ncbi:hypothetical protein BJ973_009019 [Actinoplanes tereljensis]|uniref:Uncharacterized protein n=1 Tax=Paractinoplanes tereljensis TaxID=571912 RepID=A0A919NH25_9ACTN|nr:hypothetical protein [Actinoplanes tereljensis]GIF18015.1 hypothetical protein Ate02nite_07450 [Actinoplanes tereljensis]
MAPLLPLLLLSLLPESVGDSSVVVLLLLLLDDELLESVDVVVEVVVDESSAAYAATPIPTVPARLAAIKAPVSNDVRRSPVSRFICVLPLR